MSDHDALFDALRRSADPAVVDALADLVRNGRDEDLARLNAVGFATDRGLDEEQVIAALLHASRLGLFEMSWNILCPSCGGVLDANATLKSVRQQDYHCAFCSLTSEPTLDDTVEVSFTVSPRIRRIAAHDPDSLGFWDYHRQVFYGSGLAFPETGAFDELKVALKDASIETGGDKSTTITGDTLAELARKHQLAEAVIARLRNFMDAEALRAIADGVVLDLDTTPAAEASAVALQTKLRELNTTGVPAEVSSEFDVRTDKPLLRISRRHHGNIKSSVITQDFVHGADYAALAEAANTFRGLLSEFAVVKRGEGERAKEEKVADFRIAMKWLIGEAERTTSRQRYKGLGEMNPEQLWETTMDPNVRRLLRVQIDDAIEADRVFTMLMGDEVEPRREFIEQNALRAANIDV